MPELNSREKPYFNRIQNTLTNGLRNWIQNIVQGEVEKRLDVLNPYEIAVKQSVFNNTPGDFLEFGVDKGKSFIRVVKAHHRNRKKYVSKIGTEIGSPMRFFAFDAFEGNVSIEGQDDNEFKPTHWKKSLWGYPEKSFLSNCSSHQLDMTTIHSVKGLYSETLNNQTIEKHGLKKAAIISIDCDFYEPSKLVLNFCKPLLQVGTIIIFDDWFRYRGSAKHGVYAAFTEFCTETSIAFRSFNDYLGQRASFICSEIQN